MTVVLKVAVCLHCRGGIRLERGEAGDARWTHIAHRLETCPGVPVAEPFPGTVEDY